MSKKRDDLGKKLPRSAEGESKAQKDLEWLDEALGEIADILRERHEKYGAGNISQFGSFGVLVRLSDKIARLQHSSGVDFADEATRDAWLDVIGYGLIGLAWVDGDWPGSTSTK